MTPADIKRIRRSLGLSVNGLATALGVNPDTLRRWERYDQDGFPRKEPPGAVILLLELADQSDWCASWLVHRANTPPIARRSPHSTNSDPSATTLAGTKDGAVRAANGEVE